MFFIKLFYFLKGYVIIEAEGLFIERFINICVQRGIQLHKVEKKTKTRALIKLSNSDFKKLRPIVKKTSSKIRILKKCGLPALINRYKKRYIFFAGALLFILFFTVSSQFVWSIDIKGADHIQKSLILEVLKDEGLYIGALKSRISSPRELKDSLMRSFNSITWAWPYFEGTCVRIEINEGKIPPQVVDKSIPCDVVAMRDGLIEKVTVKQGQSLVSEQLAVMAGDVLIAGTLEKADGTGFRTVHAIGDVFARTWHEKKGVYKLYNEHRIPTGNKISKYTLDFFSKSFDIIPVKNTFSEYDTFQKTYKARLGDKFHLGINLIRTEYHEIETVREQIPYDSAIAFAEFDLECQICEELLPGALKKDKKISVTNIDDETIEVTLLMEFSEKIGTQRIIYTD